MKKININLLVIMILQIFLLVNFCIAESYLINKYDSKNNLEKDIKYTKNILNEIDLVKLLKIFFSIKQIASVSATTTPASSCCPQLKNGAICQDTILPQECSVNTIPSKCENVQECKLGCCIDETEGICSTKTTKQKCESDGGKWKNEESCLIQECTKGCCVLGNQIRFSTEQNCKKLSLQYGFTEDFKFSIKTEYECLALSATNEIGACIFRGESCSIKTERDCLSKNGIFFKDSLCSNPALNTSCQKQASINCLEGKDEIYWFDSCGNRENIYSNDKISSWNNGMILKKENSCNPSSGNIFSQSCGNCNSLLGSRCDISNSNKKVQDGNFICKDLTCIDENGKKRQNGESWCVYDSYIGDGKDTVGSRHWRRMCIEGEIKVEPCADYRGQVCAQSEIKEGEKSFTIGTCTTNEAVMCISYNSDSGNMKKNCLENKDCMIKNINVDRGFKFDMCVGRYPRGFDLTGEEKAESSAQLCKMADQTCTVVYVKDWKGHWNCKENCDCESKKFTQQMNDLCISLGDCGTYINYVGKGTNNINVKGAPKISWKEYLKYAKPVNGQFAEPKDLRNSLAAVGGVSLIPGDVTSPGVFGKAIQSLGTIAGATGGIVGAAAWAGGTSFTIVSSSGAVVPVITEGSTGIAGLVSPGIQSFGTATAGFGIGMFVGSMFAKWLGLTGEGATAMSLGGGIAGLGAAGVFTQAGQALLGVVALPLLYIGIIIMIYTWLVGWGKTKTVEVKFNCMPWQAPSKGVDCKKCNQDSLKPCSKYRCTSLGKACKLLNEDTENPICESIVQEAIPPVISKGEIIKIENLSIIPDTKFKFQDEENKKINIRTNDGGCIPEFTPVLFTLKTDEYAQCKVSLNHTMKYEEMDSFQLELTKYSTNHTFVFSMPSLDSLKIYNLSGDIKEQFGNTNLYIRCQDYFENYNLDEYVVNFCIRTGPDLTPARIAHSIPENNAPIKYNLTEVPLTIYLNEPAECKYDLNNNKTYDEMSTNMNCTTDLFKSEIYGWPCNTALTNLKNSINTFYIKCKDQPWLSPENKSRNINTEGFPYTLKGSKEELKITSVSPSGKIDAGFEPMSLDLEVRTSGGIDGGENTCFYSFTGYDNMNQFFETFTREHKQNFNMMMAGDYLIYLKCKDEAENIAFENATFNLEVDSSLPIVTRVYKEGGSLKIITNERAECYYTNNNCYFDIKNGTSMTSTFSNYHAADWNPGKVYNIKCSDLWGNKPDGCSIRISPTFAGS